MTITIQRRKSVYVYKINEWNDRQILVRPNRHNARWKHYGSFDTPEQAQRALLALDSVPLRASERPDAAEGAEA